MTKKENLDSTQIAEKSTNPKISKEKATKTLTAFGLAIMTFSGVWSFGNITNGFGYFDGTRVILPILCVFVLYFLPYSLIVGELGSVFKNTDGGVSVWILKTIGPRLAFFTGWIYWIVHMPYLSQKPNSIVVAVNWLVFKNGSVSNMNVVVLCFICLVIFIIAAWLSAQGMSMVKKVCGLAGWSMFIMMVLYILLIFAAPAIKGTQLRPLDLSPDKLMPKDWSFIANISILIFAVGGCEKFAPYVKTMKNPGRGFPLGMIFLVVMVVGTSILGTISMSLMYDGENLPQGFLTNGQYDAFQQLGNYYGVGDIFVILYAASNAIGQFGAIIVSIDAPLRILLGNADRHFIPEWWFKKNTKGSYTNGIKVVAIIVSLLIMLPAIGIKDVDQLVKWLIKLNSVCMPLRYMFVFIAYIALKKAANKFINEDYTFIKNKFLGQFVGIWCFAITLFFCIAGMYSDVPFEFAMNVLTPVILCGIGLVLPQYAKYRRKHPSKKAVAEPTEAKEEYAYTYTTKEIVLFVMLSILTLGFYALYWMYRITKTTNIIADPDKRLKPALVPFLAIITFDIYSIFWAHRQADILKNYYGSLNLPVARHAPVGYTVLAAINYILPGSFAILMCLIQNNINIIIEQDLQ